MKEIFEKAFTLYTDQYRKILRNCYPAFDNKGFEERNLTNNFVTALLESLEDEEAIPWFESSIGKTREKIDGIVYSQKTKSVFFIEAKRIINGAVQRKINSINNDIDRLLVEEIRNDIISKWKKENVFKNSYIVILADVWTEKKATKEVPEKWKNNEIINEKIKESGSTEVIYTGISDFSMFPDDFRFKDSIDMYNLLISIIQIKNPGIKDHH